MLRELDQRTCYGLTVMLEWDSDTDRVSIRCEDDRAPNQPPICYAVRPCDARRAFLHPFAYAPALPPADVGGEETEGTRRPRRWRQHD
jgi:hypothetical protein